MKNSIMQVHRVMYSTTIAIFQNVVQTVAVIFPASQESSDNDSEEDERDSSHYVDVIANVDSWEENWLFQKRRIQSRSEPVAMLVPKPSEDYRALIGDKDAEETSDLSDLSSSALQSDEEIERELNAINSVIPKSCEESGNKAATAEEEDENSGELAQGGEHKSTKGFALAPLELNEGERKFLGNSTLTPAPTPVSEDAAAFTIACDLSSLSEKLEIAENSLLFESENEGHFKVVHATDVTSSCNQGTHANFRHQLRNQAGKDLSLL